MPIDFRLKNKNSNIFECFCY